MKIKVNTVDILGVPIAAVSLDEAVSYIENAVEMGRKTYITATSIHGIMESQDDPKIMRIHSDAGMCVPDGMPNVWIGRMLGYKNMQRVYGPDLMLEVLKRFRNKGYSHFFYGGKEGVPEILQNRLIKKFPGVKICGTLSPPFRHMNEREEGELSKLVEQLSPDIIWVGLSTPKQEIWMAEHIKRLNAKVMIGVGAAFDFHAGLLQQAPNWVQKIGMEWFFRMCMEPRRLSRRYLKNIPRFIYKVIKQFLIPRIAK
jgi:N-acetylglucosaminyldiphosphoundecaprenol N-acetyl-beta-D-mannosaminyltransferase